MGTVSLRTDRELALQAEREVRTQNRSKANRLEYWENDETSLEHPGFLDRMNSHTRNTGRPVPLNFE